MRKQQEQDDKEELKPVVVHEWCGTVMREGRTGCPRGPACQAESREWDRLVRLDEIAQRMGRLAERETARTIGGGGSGRRAQLRHL